MQDIVCNMITYLIITVVMALLGNNAVVLGRKDVYRGGRKESFEDGFYTIQCDKVAKVIVFIGLLFFIAFFVMVVLTYLDICVIFSKGADIGTVIAYSLIVLFYLFGFSVIVIWRVVVDDNEIIYRNYLGKTKRYTFDDISEIKELKNHKIIVYSKGKKIFSIDKDLPTGVFLLWTAREKGVPVRQSGNSN